MIVKPMIKPSKPIRIEAFLPILSARGDKTIKEMIEETVKIIVEVP